MKLKTSSQKIVCYSTSRSLTVDERFNAYGRHVRHHNAWKSSTNSINKIARNCVWFDSVVYGRQSCNDFFALVFQPIRRIWWKITFCFKRYFSWKTMPGMNEWKKNASDWIKLNDYNKSITVQVAMRRVAQTHMSCKKCPAWRSICRPCHLHA